MNQIGGGGGGGLIWAFTLPLPPSYGGGGVVYFIVRLSRLYYMGQSQGWVSDQARDRILHVGGP
jgi:hypothetical protein